MKVMVLVKASKDSEAGALPSEQLLREMGKFNEELVKAGIPREYIVLAFKPLDVRKLTDYAAV